MKNLTILLFVITVIAFGCKTANVNSTGIEDANSMTSESVKYKIAIGETFEIKLKSNPTTGYKWKWLNKEAITVVDYTGNSYVTDTPAMIGTGGNDTWTFTGIKSGTETIILGYGPAWIDETERVKKIVVKVKK